MGGFNKIITLYKSLLIKVLDINKIHAFLKNVDQTC